MGSYTTNPILIIGGTGAQGLAVVRYLSSTGSYNIRCITRDASSSNAKKLASIKHVSLVPGGTSGFDEKHLKIALEGVDYVWVNTNGFALGEAGETYWGIQMFQMSVRAGVKHFIYSGLESAYKASGYDPKCHVGHFEGKARVSEWMLSQPQSPMAWTVLDSSAYLESLSEIFSPRQGEDGAYTFYWPLDDGAIPMIYLEDNPKYVHWAYQNPKESNGLRFAMATCHVSGADAAAALTAVSGKPAKYQTIPTEMYLEAAFGKLPKGVDTKVGFLSTHESALLQTYAEDFGNWFNLYKATKSDNTGLLTRPYDCLDKILPDRVKGLEEWMRLVGYTGEKQALLKDLSDLGRLSAEGKN